MDKNRTLEGAISNMVTGGLLPRNPLNNGIPDILVKSIVDAVIDELKNNAEVIVSSGSSAGSWPIQ
jgi:hypothetical protein